MLFNPDQLIPCLDSAILMVRCNIFKIKNQLEETDLILVVIVKIMPNMNVRELARLNLLLKTKEFYLIKMFSHSS